MIPQILNLGPLPMNRFGLMVALGLVAAIVRLGVSFERANVKPELADSIVFLGGISGILGARVWYVGTHYNELRGDLLGALLSSAGFVFYGGFIIGALVVITYARRVRLSVATLADSLGPSLALAYAIGRLGCQLSGDGDYGMATSSWIGMSYATGVVPTAPGVLVYPTPFFESCLALLILLPLSRAEISPAWQAPGRRFGLYLVLMSLERFFVEFIRIEARVVPGLSQAQIVALVLIGLGGALMLRRQAPLAMR